MSTPLELLAHFGLDTAMNGALKKLVADGTLTIPVSQVDTVANKLFDAFVAEAAKNPAVAGQGS